MKLKSPKFEEGGIIPSLYTCEGKQVNPPLEITGVPPGAKSLVLLMEDPDVPKSLRPDGMFDHWVVFNIPPQTQKIAEHSHSLAVQGRNTKGKDEYFGPCPPNGEHRYFFKLYALDTLLSLPPGSSKKEVEEAMKGHLLASCQLMGRYEKGKGY